MFSRPPRFYLLLIVRVRMRPIIKYRLVLPTLYVVHGNTSESEVTIIKDLAVKCLRVVSICLKTTLASILNIELSVFFPAT